MTVIAACVKDGKAAMASDSLGTMGDLALPGRRKLFPYGDAMLGYCGASIFSRPLSMLPQCDIGHEEEFCLLVAAAIRQFIADNTLDTEVYGCTVLVTALAGIWIVTSDGDVEKIDGEYWAIGSGGEVALGALYVAASGEATTTEMVGIAVETACALTISCGGDVTIMDMEPTSKPKPKSRAKAKTE